MVLVNYFYILIGIARITWMGKKQPFYEGLDCISLWMYIIK